MKYKFTTILLGCFFSTQLFSIVPNQLLTRGVVAKTSDGDNSYITDGQLTGWKNSKAKDIAIQISNPVDTLLITWESMGDFAWATDFTTGCSHNGTPLKNFKILTSANSTDGKDGDWEEVAVVENNPVMSRALSIPFSGKSWFRFVSDESVGEILEIEAFDISNGGNDTWFFMGTSISQMGMKQQDTDTTVADLIHARFPNYTPAMLRGGIGCINSTEVVARLSDYLKYAGTVKYWAIEMGTNDAWGGGDWNAETFRKNMQTIIDSAQARGITPVLARIIATDPDKAGWQVNPKFLQIIDDLTEKNSLPQGPDFYSYFESHPELLGSDGVHPNGSAGGGQAMHHLWAEALAPLYEQSGSTGENDVNINQLPKIRIEGNSIFLSDNIDKDCLLEIISMNGAVLESCRVAERENVITTNLVGGNYILVLKTPEKVFNTKIFLPFD